MGVASGPEKFSSEVGNYAFRKKKTVVHRAFQTSWFRSWPLIHYNEGRDHILCYNCCKDLKQKYLSSTTLGASDGAFVTCPLFFFYTDICINIFTAL